MNLIFDSAEVMSMNHTLEYWGDFNFRNRRSFSVEGILLDNSFEGVSGIWNQMSGVISTAHDFEEITINGVSFGSGVLENISFSPNNDVRNKRYSASVSTFHTGNLFNLSGSYFSGLGGLASERLDLVESMTEDFSFSRNEDRIFNYDRTLNIKTISGVNEAPQDTAKSIAAIIFSGSINLPFINSIYPAFYLESGRKYHRESYDLINGEFQFSENFLFQDSDPFIWAFNHTVEFKPEFSSVVEKGYFRGVDVNNYTTAKEAYQSNIGGSYSRCNSVYQNYIGTGCSLINSPVSRSLGINRFLGQIDYEESFSDNPNNITGCIWDYEHTFSKQENGFYEVSEAGTVKGQGRRTYAPNQQYVSASGCFDTIEAGVQSRLLERFVYGFLGNCQTGIYLQNTSIEDSEYDGLIGYSINYGSDSAFNQISPIDYAKGSYQTDNPTPSAMTIPIINDKEIITPVFRGNSSLGVFSNTIRVVGDADESAVSTLLNKAETLVEVPTGDDPHIEDAGYVFDPFSRTLELNVVYNYIDHKTFEDITV